MIVNITKQLQKISIIHIILISFSLHMFLISKPNYEVLDEVYFTVFLRWFLLGIDHTPYQLPGLSFIVAPFVYLFGDNWFSWRFAIIIFGMVFLYFYYKVIEHISNKKFALLSTVILSLSPLIFVHSSLMLRDIPVMALGFLSIYLYFKQKYYLAALIIGLAGLIKETAFFFVVFIALHYILTNRERILIRVSGSLEKRSMKFLKTPLFTFLILSASFLIPLTIYDNTITILEYQTTKPEFKTRDENGKLMGMRFDIIKSNDELYQKSVNDFNYMNKVKDPFNHLSLYSTKGYLNLSEANRGEFIKSFLPIGLSGHMIAAHSDRLDKTDLNRNNMEIHKFEYPTMWVQSMINYSWWYVAFWSCIALIGYFIFQRIKNKVNIPNSIKFIFCGLVFFVPYLFISMFRDTYSYYMIYFLPIMAFGLITVIYKIPKKLIRHLILLFTFVGITYIFSYVFPIWLVQ